MKYDIPEDELRRMYVEEEMSQRQIASHYDCSTWVIKNRIKKYNIPLRNFEESCKLNRLNINKNEFINLYMNKGMSINDLVDYYGCTRTPILKRINEYNLPKFDFTKQFIIPKDELYDLYIEKNMSRKELANYYNCCEGTIDNNLQEYGIKKGNDVLTYNISKEELYDLYINKNISMKEISEYYGCSDSVVLHILNKFNIKKEEKEKIKKEIKSKKMFIDINEILRESCESGHLVKMQKGEKYQSAKNNNWYECECGWVFETNRSRILANIKYNDGIYKCPSQRKHVPWNYIMVKKEFNKRGFVLLSDTYESNKHYLDYICPKGHKNNIRFNNFIRGEGCKDCATIEMADEKRHSISYIKKYLEKYDCRLISDYKNSHSENEFICSCGRKGSKMFATFKRKPQCNYCSLEGRSGENHVFWNDDLTEEERLTGRQYPEYTQWRIDVYSRDNYTCQITGEKGSIVAHHLYSYADYPELRLDIDNGITIKEGLHIIFHKIYGYGSNNKKQFEEFKERYYNGEFDEKLKEVV